MSVDHIWNKIDRKSDELFDEVQALRDENRRLLRDNSLLEEHIACARADIAGKQAQIDQLISDYAIYLSWTATPIRRGDAT